MMSAPSSDGTNKSTRAKCLPTTPIQSHIEDVYQAQPQLTLPSMVLVVGQRVFPSNQAWPLPVQQAWGSLVPTPYLSLSYPKFS